MVTLPVVERELRVLSRQNSLYWSRWVFAGIALAGAALFLLSTQGGKPSQIGLALFGTLSVITLIYCMLMGIWLTSDCISEERRGNTLGLLFLTDLKGHDVVLGKMMATSVRGLYGVIAIFPILALPLLMGGLVFGEFLRIAVVLVLAMLLSLSVGVAISSLSRLPVRAAVGTFFVLLAVFGWGPFVAFLISISSPAQAGASSAPFLVHSLPFAMTMAFESSYLRGAVWYWASIGINVGMVWIFLVLACRRVRKGWRGEGTSDSKRPDAATSVVRRAATDDVENPVMRAYTQQASKPYWVGSIFVLAGLYWSWGTLQFGRDFVNEGNYLFTAIVMQLVIKCWVAAEAGRRLGEARQSGALELLLCTPLTVRQLLQGHIHSLYWQFLWPVMGLLLLNLVFLLEPISSSWGLADPSNRYWVRMCAANMVLLVLDLYALAWLGLWRGFCARQPTRAIVSTLTWVLLVPWLVFICLTVLSAFTGSMMGTVGGRSSEMTFLGLWFVIGLLSSVGWLVSARTRLLQELRELAPQPLGTTPGHSESSP